MSATKAQIESAARRWYVTTIAGKGRAWDEMSVGDQANWCASTEALTAHIVRPDERIIALDDLKDLRWIGRHSPAYDRKEFWERIDALIAGNVAP